AGMLCLLADLGRPERLLYLLTSPEPSAIAVGAYALVLALVCAGGFSLVELLDGLRIRPAAVGGVAAVGVAAPVQAASNMAAAAPKLITFKFFILPSPLLYSTTNNRLTRVGRRNSARILTNYKRMSINFA
ncbi:MAG TPA: hypothetical protein PKY60_14020, partial [Thermoflexales bacterium]|nr:hypothetical protein [Thermoflexales bacterium]